jgi:hypothetical protein
MLRLRPPLLRPPYGRPRQRHGRHRAYCQKVSPPFSSLFIHSPPTPPILLAAKANVELVLEARGNARSGRGSGWDDQRRYLEQCESGAGVADLFASKTSIR